MEGNRQNRPGPLKGSNIVFGIIMIIVYIGMGILLFCDVFGSIGLNYTVAVIIGILLCIYGVWRAIRLFKGWN